MRNSHREIVEVVEPFDDRFTFTDHALAIEFTDKERLTEFLHKSRELFPDTALEVVSIFESGDYAIDEWKPTATQTVPYGSISYRSRILLPGSTMVRIENRRLRETAKYL